MSIETSLQQAFTPAHLEIQDDSHKHAGHVEAKRHGGGHFTVILVSAKFEQKSRLERHRLVNDALKAEFDEGAIHALRLKLFTPTEWHQVSTE